MRLSPMILAAALLLGACSPGDGELDPIVGRDDGGGADGGDATTDDGSGPRDVGSETDVYLDDPLTCEEAAWRQTYVGCDFWPTVLPNYVGTHFDYAVVVSNAGDVTAEVRIERGGALVAEGTVEPSGLTKFFLPWVDELKHWTGMCDTDVPGPSALASREVPDGAYHLTSTRPVTVYQFNPIEYGPQGGPPDRDWSTCTCLFGCHSYTNDASLLLPSTSLTGNYRITAPAGQNTEDVRQPGYFSVTGFSNGTHVRARIGRGGAVTGGGGIPDAGPGEIIEFDVDRGEVVLVIGTSTTDLSGTVLNADSPVQVMSGAPCHYMPDDRGACDHMEETVLPAESLGTRYFVVVPSNPRGVPIGHVVRFYGNVDGTHLTYSGAAPAGAPATIDAGEVADLGVVRTDFEVAGDHELGVTSFLLGSSMADPGHFTDQRGDPAQSNVVAVEQYRKKYVFLAPDDYDFSFADVVAPDGTVVFLDGDSIGGAWTPIAGGHSVLRIPLDESRGGAHVLECDLPCSLQVVGYGFATSYHYPGGLNTNRIAEPPFI